MAKTKIVVIQMKELIYTAIFAGLGILLIVLLIIMFLPDKSNKEKTGSTKPFKPSIVAGKTSFCQ